ncbi:hypothetical protein J3459_017586 [Metarhizium acridum]|nr:hypothetical protein J3459_017586 [Metarhizium acridum]
MTFPLPFEWNDKAFTVRPSVAAGVCKFFRDYGCVANDFEVAYSGNDNLDEFGDGHFNRMISFSRCEGAGSREETQIERPPTESQEISGVHVCESDRFSPSCRRFPVADGDCGVDLYSDKKLKSFYDQVKSFRCDSSQKKPVINVNRAGNLSDARPVFNFLLPPQTSGFKFEAAVQNPSRPKRDAAALNYNG